MKNKIGLILASFLISINVMAQNGSSSYSQELVVNIVFIAVGIIVTAIVLVLLNMFYKLVKKREEEIFEKHNLN